jgi:8-oxo-dGTP pyrophosphatase MutT (NUDIX family)
MWKQLTTRIAYANPWIRVVEDQVLRPDGVEGIYGVVELHNPAVWIVALTDADEVLMVNIHRYTVGESLEVPAGGTDGQDPQEAAARELAEETGHTASSWEQVGFFNSLNGLCRAPGYVFVARDLSPIESHSMQEEGITEIRRVPWSGLHDLLASGAVTDAESLCALTLASIALKRPL